MKEPVDKGMKKKKSTGDVIADFLIYLVCLIFIILCIYPFYYIMIYSISDPNQQLPGWCFCQKASVWKPSAGYSDSMIFRLHLWFLF